ncbi:hypothetical protein Gpo141_00005139 [Globisporangium polare]
MADLSSNSSRLGHADGTGRMVRCRSSFTATARSRPACVHGHHQTDLTYPDGDEHSGNAENLALGFILNNNASTGTAGDGASAMWLHDHDTQQQPQRSPYVPSSSLVELTRQAIVRSNSFDDRRGHAPSLSSSGAQRAANSQVPRRRPALADYASSPSPVSSCIQHMQVSSPATTRRPRTASSSAFHGDDGATEQSKLEKKRGRMCKTEGCKNYIVHKGLCCRHGGGKKCSIEGCTTSAKHLGLCWKHGGSTECDIDGCTKRAKARRLCWAHGGGTRCTNAECEKVAVTGGLCWAHGGGKRCNFDDCNKPAYERKHNFCTKHHAEMQHVNYFEV